MGWLSEMILRKPFLFFITVVSCEKKEKKLYALKILRNNFVHKKRFKVSQTFIKYHYDEILKNNHPNHLGKNRLNICLT